MSHSFLQEETMDERFAKDLDFAMELLTNMLESEKHSPETVSAYCEDVRGFLLWWGSRGNPIYGRPEVTREDVVTYLNGLIWSLLPEELNRILAALRVFFSFHHGFIEPEESPTWRIPNYWDYVKAYSWLDSEQQGRLETAIDQQLHAPLDSVSWQANWTRAAALVRFLLHTGMHATEALALRVDDVRLGDTLGMVHVRGKQDRNVQLDAPACLALGTWLSIRPEVGQGWLWVEIDQGIAHRISKQAVLRACWWMSQLAGLGPRTITPRVLRNTCAHNLLAAGMAPHRVKRLLRFKSIDVVCAFE